MGNFDDVTPPDKLRSGDFYQHIGKTDLYLRIVNLMPYSDHLRHLRRYYVETCVEMDHPNYSSSFFTLSEDYILKNYRLLTAEETTWLIISYETLRS